VVPQLSRSEADRIIDVGTGGGLPGMVLAICFPDRHFTLLDSAGKKMRFLFQAKQELALTNVDLQDCRVEHFQPQIKYDIVISRAFSAIQNMLEWCAHLLHSDGEFWAMKGKYPEQELSEIAKHYIVVEHCELLVPDLYEERCLIKLRRTEP
jgi:16S rRNA (guanine527-N7)-methyltransferase